MRVLVAVVLLVLVASPAPATASSGRRTAEQALGVLHRWDAQRAAAWAQADAVALRRLYVPGSTAAEADTQLLGRWTARGFVVRRLRTQVFSLSVLRWTPNLLRMRLLDRVAGGSAYDGDAVVPLPAGPPEVRIVELCRGGGKWRVASVRTLSGSGPGPPRAPHARRGR